MLAMVMLVGGFAPVNVVSNPNERRVRKGDTGLSESVAHKIADSHIPKQRHLRVQSQATLGAFLLKRRLERP